MDASKLAKKNMRPLSSDIKSHNIYAFKSWDRPNFQTFFEMNIKKASIATGVEPVRKYAIDK